MKKQKFKNLAIFLLCSVFLTLFEPFGSASANAAINRSISSESDKIASVDDDGNLRFKLSAQAASLSQAIQQEETVKKAQKQKIVYFLTSFQKVVQNQIKKGEILLSLPSPSPKTSLTACVTKPV